MRRKQRWGQLWGRITIVAGLLVLLSQILPVGFWWFVLGIALISVGIYMKRCC